MKLSSIFLLRLYLTFDTEDFISKNAMSVLHKILESLKKYELKGLFFVTGHVAEKLQDFPLIIDLMNEHEVGYHSSSHSVHPTIFEFTDIKDYSEAYKVSIQRETAHVNPLNGEIEGKGGIHALKDIFPKKKITAFRAPGHCWSPPHLEALRSLGIQYDFSTNISSSLVAYKDITFYPHPLLGHWQGTLSEYRILLVSSRHGLSIMTIHPSLLVNQDEWDAIYYKSNPKKLAAPTPRNPSEAASLYRKFDVLLRQFNDLQKIHVLEVSPNLKKSKRTLSLTKIEVDNCYRTSIKWAGIQGYTPRFMHDHFLRFFGAN